MTQVILIGFMGAGKTTIGRLLASDYDLPFVDLDQVIVEQIGMSIPDYFAKYGETTFRQQESLALVQCLKQNGIIATGGGIITSMENRDRLQQSKGVVYLAADPHVMLKRIKSDRQGSRPVAASKSDQELLELFAERQPYYLAVADFILETARLTPAEVVKKIRAWKGS